MASLWTELKRRNVIRLSVLYSIAGAVFLMLPSVTAQAQIERYMVPEGSDTDSEQGEDQSRGGDHLARMQKNLGLSDEQVSQLREIRQRGGSREEIRAVFTDEQWALMQERRRQAKSQKGKGKPGRYYTPPPGSQTEESDGG